VARSAKVLPATNSINFNKTARQWCAITLMAVLGLPCTAFAAESYPVRPLRVLTTQPGSANDFFGRLVAPAMSASLGQQLIIDNRGIIAMDIAAKARPDGYTLLMYGSTVWLSPFMRKVAWDPVRDFAPVTLTVSSPQILVVHPTLQVKTVEDLINMARAKPGALNYAAGTPGAGPHLAGELFKAMAKVDIVTVPYKGSGPALTGLVGGQVHFMFPNAGAAAPHVASGRLKAIAVTSARPSPLVPGVPTIAATGLPGFEAVSVIGAFVPAGTPAAIIQVLHRELAQAMNQPANRDRLFAAGMEVVGNSPAEFAALIKAEMARLGRIISEAGIRE